MTNNQNRIDILLEKLEVLLKKQQLFSAEIDDLRREIYLLKTSEAIQAPAKEEEKSELPPVSAAQNIEKGNETVNIISDQHKSIETPLKESDRKFNKSPKLKSDLEKFIGENLINKIGIVITIIGVAIGAKYSIDHDLISPLTRIILGYLAGIGLLGFGMRLKKSYESYSAVLVSGAMTIMYFITFFAYSFYDLIPQSPAFALMVLFTIFTVIAAVNYSQQVIALIGLVGAYAVPFLLSNESGNAAILFSYMSIINIGILVTAFKKYWKPLYYASFVLTWFIYFFWYALDYRTENHFDLALSFLFIFFVIFYLTFLAYKLVRKEKFKTGDVLLLLANSFIFYALGYSILNNYKGGEELLGLFTLANALLHFIVSVIIFRQKLADRNLFYLISGLVLVFITMAIPVQLDGNWVTLLWVIEAALLFWIGRTKNVPVYEKLSYPLMFLAFFSIIHDWTFSYEWYYSGQQENKITPLFNINFLSALLFIAAFGFINILNRSKKYASPLINKKGFLRVIAFAIPVIFLLTIYYTFRIEIATYWNQLYANSSLNITPEGEEYASFYRNTDLPKFKSIWIINYSLLFLSVLCFVNFKKLKSRQLGIVNLVFNALFVLVFLIQGLFLLSELRESYLEQTLAEYYQRSVFNIGIRYISIAFFTLLLFASYKYIQQEFMKIRLHMIFNLSFHIAVLWLASSELIHWMDMGDASQPSKLGLSILWGSYSLLLIVLGIWKKRQYLRIGAIVLFGITLIKLFFYDISHLNTIAKTIVFVSLGILLLIISFLYNKYKQNIANES